MKNTNLLLSGLLLVGATIPTVQANASEDENEQNSRKNILFIAVDDLKPLLGCYGNPIVKTPHIDRLASQGTLFTNAYCQQAVSGPTRASLLTGMCPDHTRVWDLKTLIRSQNPDVVTLPQHFKNNGYVVAGIGKIYDPRSVDKSSDEISWSVPYIDSEGYMNKNYEKPVMAQYQDRETRTLYQKYLAEAESQGLKKRKAEVYIQKYIKPTVESADVPDDAYFDGGTANGAVRFLNDYNENKPFFLAVGFKKPHLPFCAPAKYWELYNRADIPLAEYRQKAVGSPELAYHKCGELMSYTDIPPLASFSDIKNVELPDEKARELIHGYYACISYMDAQVGKVLDALREKGLEKNTIIVFWGDHGWHLGDHGLWNKHTNFEHATHVPMLIVEPSSPGKKVDVPVEFLDIYPTLCELAGLERLPQLEGESLVPVITGKNAGNTRASYAVSQFPRGKSMGYSIRDTRYRYTVWVDWTNKVTNSDKIVAEELYDYQKDPNETINVVKDATYKAALEQMKAYWSDYCKRRIN